MKAQVLAECEVPGASVAKVAMLRGINANVVHGWRKLARAGGEVAVARSAEFIRLTLQDAGVARAGEHGIEVELRRGAVTMQLTWPLSAAVDFGAWTRELLRQPRGRWAARRLQCSPGSGAAATAGLVRSPSAH